MNGKRTEQQGRGKKKENGRVEMEIEAGNSDETKEKMKEI